VTDSRMCDVLRAAGAIERYVAGTLPESDLEAFEAHLLLCHRCQEDVRLGMVVREMLPGFAPTRRFGWRQPWLLAASILLAVAVGVWLRQERTRLPTDPSGSVALMLRMSPPPESWIETGWSVARGDAASGLDENAVAFRVGARLLDLQLAHRAGESRDMVSLAGEIARYLGTIPYAEPARAEVDRFRAALAAHAPADRVDTLNQVAEAVVRATLPADPLTAGLWCEAARMAARAGDSAFFVQSRDLTRITRWLARQARTRAEARAVQSILDDGVTSDRLPELARLFDMLVRTGGG
jgi:Putative zinc-finger